MPEPTFEQVKAAMAAMIQKAEETPNEPVAMAIVDSTGNLMAYAKMDNLRLFSRRHALRKAYTAAIVGQDTGAHGQRLHSQGRSIKRNGRPPTDPRPGRSGNNEGWRYPGRCRGRRLPQRSGRRRPGPGGTGCHERLENLPQPLLMSLSSRVQWACPPLMVSLSNHSPKRKCHL